MALPITGAARCSLCNSVLSRSQLCRLLELGHGLRALFQYKDENHLMKLGGAGASGVGLHVVPSRALGCPA